MSKHTNFQHVEKNNLAPSSNLISIAVVATITVIFLILGVTALSGSSQKSTSGIVEQTIKNHHGTKKANMQVFTSLLGKEAPDFTLERYEGKQVNLKELRGKKVVLFFTEGLMCYPACWNQMAAFAQDTAFTKEDVIVLNITVDRKDEWKQAVDKMPELGKALVLFDTSKTVSNTYGVLSLDSSMHKGDFPGHTYLILDRKGIIRFAKDDSQMAVRNDELKTELSKIE